MGRLRGKRSDTISIEQNQARRRTWIILALIVGGVGCIGGLSAGLTVAWLTHSPSRSLSSQPSSSSPLIAEAERKGLFGRLNQQLKLRQGAISIDGNVVVVEGKMASYHEMEVILKAVRTGLAADSLLIIHGNATLYDDIEKRYLAIRDGEYNYQAPEKSVVVVDLMVLDPERIKFKPGEPPPEGVPPPISPAAMEMTLKR